MALAMDDLWREALVAEDCLQVRQLWEQSLLKSVLAMEGQSQVKLQDHEVGGKARTALHVAARRGDLKLMQDILNMGSDDAHHSAGGHSGECPDSSNCYLLKFVDPEYDLDALVMAAVNGNRDTVNLLKRASLRCQSSNPYKISNNHAGGKNQGGDDVPAPSRQTIYAESDVESDNSFPKKEYISELSRRTNEFLKEKSEFSEKLEELYYEDCDFNFLPIAVYLFHFTFSKSLPIGPEVIPARYRIISKPKLEEGQVCSSKLASYWLSELLDGQGRTLLHVAVDSEKVKEVLAIIPTDGSKDVHNKADGASMAPLAILPANVRVDILNKADGAGRTPLFRAAAKGKIQAVNLLLKNLTNIYVVATKVKYPANKWGKDLDIDELSRRNHFPSSCVYFEKETNIKSLPYVSSSALHAAIIHKQEDIVKALLSHDRDRVRKKNDRFFSDTDCFRLCPWPELPGVSPGKPKDSFSTMQLAVLVENITIVQELEKDFQLKQRVQKAMEGSPDSFLLSAAMGNPEVIKAFIVEGRDPLVTDRDRNTALHYAMQGKPVQFHPHMVDFVGCDHVYSWRRITPASASVASQKTTEKNYAQTTGSIHLLLRAGINISSYNKNRRTAYPKADAPEEFAKWWYEKEEKQAQADLKNLNGAANAISVTAALVATASYLGPFQPPLGYGADSIQAEIMAVKIFVVCNSVSFYFALAAIMYALLPSTLPIIQESTSRALDKTRLLVAIALAFLLPSIICVLSAFAASYIAVIPDRGAAHQGLAVITTIAAGSFCLIAIIRFAVRYLNILVTLDLKDLILPKEIFGWEELWSIITRKHKNK
ncbi:unnamed protein product [Calypogeia fissa]